jgi:Flp pilus assembly protein TadD
VPNAELAPELRNRPLDEQLAALKAGARESGTARSHIAYGVGLQRAGRPVSAGQQFEEAARVDPDNAEARTAAAIGRFEKSDPTPAFATLGQLTTVFPNEAVVRYHLALALIWINDVGEARNQLVKAADTPSGGFYQAEAGRLLDRLDEVGTPSTGETDDDGPS